MHIVVFNLFFGFLLLPLWFSGEISNTATFVNQDGFIKLKAWSPPSNGVISLFFKTPYKKGVLLYNGMLDKDFFQVGIVNETSVGLSYNIGNGVRKIELSLGDKQVNDRSWHHIMIYHNMKVFGFRLDNQEGKHENPLFLKRELNLDNELYVAGYPYDVSKGFVGCIRGLVSSSKANFCLCHRNILILHCNSVYRK